MTPTPKTIRELITARPELAVIGISKKGGAERIWLARVTKVDFDIELSWFEDWSAWSVRLKSGPYQQICIFEPKTEPTTDCLNTLAGVE